jgi:hypothetical protein
MRSVSEAPHLFASNAGAGPSALLQGVAPQAGVAKKLI